MPATFDQRDEALVADCRAELTPTDLVERRLVGLLRGVAVAGSHLRSAGLRGPAPPIDRRPPFA